VEGIELTSIQLLHPETLDTYLFASALIDVLEIDNHGRSFPNGKVSKQPKIITMGTYIICHLKLGIYEC
jgi:hypothetical protein